MAKIKKLTVALVIALMTLSCSDMMDIDSDRIVYADDNTLDNANDSIYSIIGVLSRLQVIADRCIIMNELRGDLMTVDAANASTDLQDIDAFSFSEDNAYAGRRDFYDVINNCNYIIANMDTTITEGQTKVMLPEYAQAKTWRAWTYLQMALIFGTVNYIEEPLLSVDDMSKVNEGQTMGLDELATTLIADLIPVCDARPLDYGTVDGWSSSEFFLPTKMLIGDLYLYSNQYDMAAYYYYSLINDRSITVSSGYANYWSDNTRSTLSSGHINAYRDEVLTRIPFDSELGSFHSQMRHLTYSETPSLLPTEWLVEDMELRTHFHSDGSGSISRYFNGDLRGCPEYGTGKTEPDAFGPATVENAAERTLITKFYNNISGSTTDDLESRPLTSVTIARPTMLYLRFAEAINRLGYPSVAFATLKYGLSSATLNDTLKVDSAEVNSLPAYINFSSSTFDSNCGTAARGCGLGVSYDKEQYVIPEDADDKIAYVEEAILEEMAAETCFEGTRFFDLLCVSRHRDDHPAFFAEKVSEKYTDNEAMKQQLLDSSCWWAR